MKKKFILITGASTGIGLEMAKQLASKKYNLILVARSEEKLKVLKQELEKTDPVTIHIISKDLSKTENVTELFHEIQDLNLEVEILVNNAGIGLYGDFTKTSLDEELKMINLNISSLVALSKLFSQEMVKNKSGKIMNVASILSFLPFPYYSVYSATKTFVLAFSETLAAELKNYGITVTALCPGPIDTPFTKPEMLNTNAYKSNKPISPKIVAKEGVDLLLNGTGKKIVGFNNWFIAQLPRITPSSILMKIKKKLASQQN